MKFKKWNGIERRRSIRHLTCFQVDMFFKGLKHVTSQKTLNIGEGGLFVLTKHRAKLGDRVHLRVIMKDQNTFFNVIGKVVWVSIGMNFPRGVGIEFIELVDADRKYLQQVLSKFEDKSA